MSTDQNEFDIIHAIESAIIYASGERDDSVSRGSSIGALRYRTAIVYLSGYLSNNMPELSARLYKLAAGEDVCAPPHGGD